MSERAFFTLREVAGLFGLPYTTVGQYCREGRFPSVRYGRRVLIPASFVRDEARSSDRQILPIPRRRIG